MIQLYPPILKGRWLKEPGQYVYLDIEGRWENVLKCTSQKYGLENTNPLILPQYQSYGLKGHNGFDIVTFDGDPVIASHDGIVTSSGADSSGGLGVEILDKLNQFKTIYWHNKINLVKVGDKVQIGDLIAFSNSTGFSTGTHVHWGFKQTDSNGNTINTNNGYWGALDPTPYLTDTPMLKLVIKDKEQYIRDSKGIDWHIFNIETLNDLFKAGIISNLLPESVDIINSNGKEWISLTRE